MSEANVPDTAVVDRDPTQPSTIRKELMWSAIWFAALLVARVASVFVADVIGLDESERTLLTRPVAFATNVAFMAVAMVGFLKYVFSNTLGQDMGTRFNRAWNNLSNPWHVVLSYLIVGVGLLISFALLLGMN